MSESKDESRPELEPDCDICKIMGSEREGFVLDSPHWRVIVSRDQGYLGRCMVIPLRHLGQEADLTEEEVLEFHYLKVGLEAGIKRAFGATLCNWTELGNDAFQASEPKPHLHHHMRPRYAERVMFEGTSFDDPKWGHMYDLDQRWNVDKDERAIGFKAAVAEAIRISMIQNAMDEATGRN